MVDGVIRIDHLVIGQDVAGCEGKLILNPLIGVDPLGKVLDRYVLDLLQLFFG